MTNMMLLFAKITMGDAKIMKGYLKKQVDGCDIYPNENEIKEFQKEAFQKGIEDFQNESVILNIKDKLGKELEMKGMLEIKEEMSVGGQKIKKRLEELQEGTIEIIIEK